jgi:hypothetical protein
MAWLCPTFQRPERLAELAISWVRHAPGKKLFVRVWKDDPRKEDYLRCEWPEEWELFEGEYQGAGESLQHLWRMMPDERSYGFIGDDIVLRTPGAIDRLEEEARDWFIAYPNDTFQRNRLPTHFCVGGKLTNVLGWLVPNGIRHGYMDLPLLNVGLNTGLLRYCPDVIFQHKHFLLDESGRDATYALMYKENGELEDTPWVTEDKERLDAYYERFIREDITKVMRALVREFEDQNQWATEDAEAASA